MLFAVLGVDMPAVGSPFAATELLAFFAPFFAFCAVSINRWRRRSAPKIAGEEQGMFNTTDSYVGYLWHALISWNDAEGEK